MQTKLEKWNTEGKKKKGLNDEVKNKSQNSLKNHQESKPTLSATEIHNKVNRYGPK